MTWEYLIGSEKYFEGAPDWCTHVSEARNGHRLSWEEGSEAKNGNRYQYVDSGKELFYECLSRIKLKIVAQRRKRESKQWDGAGLPPVGCECEALIPCRGESLHQWRKVKVVYSDEKVSKCIVYDSENLSPHWADEFSPLRREHEIKVDAFKLDLLNVISMISDQFGEIWTSDLSIEAISHELIMLGYEKTK